MQLTARSNTRLVGASTPAAKVTEIHEMKMEGDVMKMRAIDSLELPAGRAVSLRPGGYHLMLQDLQTTLAPGSKMALTLIFRDSKGAQSQMQLELPVQSAPMGHAASHAPGSVPSSAHKH